MNVQRSANGGVTIEFALPEAKALSGAVTQHAEDLPSVVIDLANLLGASIYNVNNSFRQPPDPWEPTDDPPPSVGR